ncbi:nitrilase-related carbon-nitrogen hydrolase [Spirosoma rhododendri]|uniref:Nitrilase n=1 Tax=Spirosoma rhododendri TaxID=2728024 RepID=A0A7L5DZT3_9BACT|nr:nitrilase-related carbon-nitrogen hydrolase [Spirosoma rhododendri]QJD81010.1 nitrilase [Spirosoma rhododendri]
MAYKVLALQVNSPAVTRLSSREEAEAQMLASVARLDQQLTMAIGQSGRDTLLVVTPEAFLTGPPSTEGIAEWRDKAALEIDGPVYEALSALVQHHQVYFCGNAYEQDSYFPELFFQTSFIIGPNGDVLLRYRRLNATGIPTPHDVWSLYLDAYGYDSLFPVAKTNVGNLACLAGDDLLYPELARCLTLRGAEVLLHATAEANNPLPPYRSIARQARAAENMAYLVSANTAGSTDSLFPMAGGGTKIIDPRGQVLAEAGTGENLLTTADIDLATIRDFRQRPAATNWLAQLRTELYADSYSQHSIYPSGALLNQTPDRQQNLRAQQEVVRRLYA